MEREGTAGTGREGILRHFSPAAVVCSCAVIYSAAGAMGFALFGFGTKGDILLAFLLGDALIDGVRVLMAVHVLLAYPITMFPLLLSLDALASTSRASLESPLTGQLWRVPVLDYTQGAGCSSLLSRLLTSVGVLALTGGLALAAAQQLQFVLALVGAVCASTLCYVLPGAMIHARIGEDPSVPRRGEPRYWMQLFTVKHAWHARGSIIAAAGMVMGVMCTYNVLFATQAHDEHEQASLQRWILKSDDREAAGAATWQSTADAKCSLNGKLNASGGCVCDSWWQGEACGQLRLGPAAQDGIYRNGTGAVQSSWGASIVADKEGSFHLFAAEWTKDCGIE